MGGGAAAPPLPATEITYFFGQNAHNSGNDTRVKILQTNDVDGISKTHKNVSTLYESLCD